MVGLPDEYRGCNGGHSDTSGNYDLSDFQHSSNPDGFNSHKGTKARGLGPIRRSLFHGTIHVYGMVSRLDRLSNGPGYIDSPRSDNQRGILR